MYASQINGNIIRFSPTAQVDGSQEIEVTNTLDSTKKYIVFDRKLIEIPLIKKDMKEDPIDRVLNAFIE